MLSIKNGIDKVGGDKMIVEAYEVGKESGTRFFTPRASLAFAKLWEAFCTILILHYWDLKCYIWIITNVSSYAIGKIFGQLTLKNSDQPHPVTLVF